MPERVGMSQSSKAGKSGSGRRKQKRGLCFGDRPLLENNAAGIDIGARELWVAVPPGRDEQTVRVFDTFTDDLQQLVQWLIQCGVTTVAMESTGVYWIPIYELLELSGIKACLLPTLPSSSVNELKPTPRRSASRWWATGAAI